MSSFSIFTVLMPSLSIGGMEFKVLPLLWLPLSESPIGVSYLDISTLEKCSRLFKVSFPFAFSK